MKSFQPWKKKEKGRGATRREKPAKPSDELRIAVTFRRRDGAVGPTKMGTRMSAGMVGDFLPPAQTMMQARKLLEKMGFEVTAAGKLSLSVRCPRTRFEKTFKTKLEKFSVDTAQGYMFSDFYIPPDGAPWGMPAELDELIDDAYIQWPHIYMNQRFEAGEPSPLAPKVEDHYLSPSEVVTLLNVDPVHRAGITGKGIHVAMIDSGFAHSHQYFEEKGYDSTAVLAPGATHRDRDGNGHGTGESANLLAVAPNATFIGIKLDNESDPTSGASILEGFQEARQHNPQIISVSLGFDLRNRLTGLPLDFLPNNLAALEAEVQAAVADGIVVVFSAGNGHIAFPGMMPEVISAGGVYIDENGSMRASDYASAFRSRIYTGRLVPDFCGLVGLLPRADYIMLPIPAGCEIDGDNSAFDGTSATDGWGRFSGTSAAAPQLAGVCALLLERDPTLTPDDVKAILRRSTRDVVQGSANPASNPGGNALRAGPGTDSATGTGLVDAFAALQQV